MDRWFVVYSKPKQEARAQQQLSLQGFETYAPLVKTQKIAKQKIVTREEYLFPRYIFIRCQDTNTLNGIRYTRGVSGLVKFGDTLASVPNGFIRELMEHQLQIAQQKTEGLFEKGQQLEILSGPFSKLNGIFLHLDGDERCMILLDFLGSSVTLSIEVNNLAAKSL